jgi:hypothetical protein
MTETVTPAAPVVPDTPAATDDKAPVVAAEKVAPAAEKVADSLIPASDGVVAEKVETPEAPKPDTAANQDEPEWFLYEGVKGVGKPPEWYKADKYKTVAAQAKAHTDLEKRFGAFTGAPENGVYEIKLPENLDGALDVEHPLLKGLQTWAAEKQMSQEGFSEAITMLAEYEASLVPDISVIKAEVGENADARISAVASWGKANLKPDEFETLRLATSGANAAAVFKTIEAVVAKSRQVRLPKPGEDVVAAQPGGEAAINAAQAKIGPDGKRLFETDAAYRAKVEKMRIEYYNSAQRAA